VDVLYQRMQIMWIDLVKFQNRTINNASFSQLLISGVNVHAFVLDLSLLDILTTSGLFYLLNWGRHHSSCTDAEMVRNQLVQQATNIYGLRHSPIAVITRLCLLFSK